jgi:8-oxo-dGTP diphosphatase
MERSILQEIPTVVPVVAAALIAPDGRVLMHRRRFGAAHGGLWEFPGGKVEPGESKELALVREIGEELGVRLEPDRLAHLSTASDPQSGIVIDLYTAHHWTGDLRCIEGEAIAWLAPDALHQLAMPPLDVPLAEALRRFLETAK